MGFEVAIGEVLAQPMIQDQLGYVRRRTMQKRKEEVTGNESKRAILSLVIVAVIAQLQLIR